MKKCKMSYLKPQMKSFTSRWGFPVCVGSGSGNTNFLNEDGTQGFMNSTIEQDADAADAASRRFDDEEYEDNY